AGAPDAPLATEVIDRARAYLGAGAAQIFLDTSGGPHPGGTGRRADPVLVAAIAREVPVVLAGALDPATVGDAVRGAAALAVDVASGGEAARAPGPRANRDTHKVV